MTNEQIADAIVARLFINGSGRHAKRLVLELEDGRDGGGWGKQAVRDQIMQALQQSQENCSKKSAMGAPRQ